jgi:putative effector of murein hydrolase LrgA (UPF0299 family)
MRAWPRGPRWLMAELILFGCLFLGMLLLHVGGPAGPVGLILALFVSVIAEVWYLNWVQDTHATWVFPLILLMIPATVVGDSIFGHAISKGEPLIVTPAYWQAFGGLLAALAVTVALAVVNGERHHGRYSYMADPSELLRRNGSRFRR